MAKKTITIRYDPKKVHDGVFEDEIEADVKDGFAIHPHLTYEDYWTVTHVKSGLGCQSYLSKAKAQQGRKIFAQIEIAGVHLADMSACEALAVYPLLLEQFRQLSGKDKPDKALMARGLEMRDYISEVICKVVA